MTGAADVLVLGGGPAGSVLATLAAERGLKVVLRRRFVSRETRSAEVRVGRRSGGAATPRRAGRVADRGRALDGPLPHQRRARVRPDVDLPALRDGRDALGVSRALMDTALLERARRAGSMSAPVAGAQPDRARRTNSRRRGLRGVDRTEAIEARIVVGADGGGRLGTTFLAGWAIRAARGHGRGSG